MSHHPGQNQHLAYGLRQPSHLNIPPPPPQNDKPILSATFIPTGDSFGPGVGIPPLDDYSTYSRYDAHLTSEPSVSHSESKYGDGAASHSYSYPNPAQPNPDIANRDNRAASTSSHRPSFNLPLSHLKEPLSPGPPTATLQNPHPTGDRGRQRAHSAAVTSNNSNEVASQWPLDRVLIWLAANGFSNDWQETFKALQLQGSDFLDLGRGPNGRGNLSMMHQTIYPQLAKICSGSKTGWDQGREREEGKRLRKLVSRLVEHGGEGPSSAGLGHRRRESGIPSASTDGNLENSPHLPRAEFGSTPGTAGPEGSPGRQMPPHFPPGVGPRNSQGRSSTMPVFSKHSSTSSTPSDSKPPDSIPNNGRADFTRGVLTGVNNRGRHSPNLSGDMGAGLLPKAIEASPNASPGLGNATPASVPNFSQPYRPEHSKSNSTDSMNKGSGHPRSVANAQIPQDAPRSILPSDALSSGRFYADRQDRRDAQEMVRPSPLDTHRTWSSEHGPGPGGKDQSKGFLSKFIRRKNENAPPHGDDHGLESPTSPGLRQMFRANGSDSALMPRPLSATTLPDDEKFLYPPRRAPAVSRRYMFVTPDHWNYRLVDVTDVESAIALRSLVCIELGIADAEYAQIYVTEPGQTEHENPLSDNLLVAVRSRTDNTGSLKLYVQSSSLSAGPGSTGLGVSFAQRGQGSADMVKSNSSGGINRDYDSMDPSLQKRADDYQRQTEARSKAYWESRRQPKDQGTNTYHGTAIRGNTVIDFDSPRMSPFEDKKVDSLVPVRRPPTAPAESTTLTKVNSLRARGSGSRASLDALKRISDPIAEEDLNRGKKRSSNTGTFAAGGIGAALANVGKMAGAPVAVGSQGRPQQDRSHTMSTGEYEPRGNNTGKLMHSFSASRAVGF